MLVMTSTSNKPSPKPQHPADSTNADGEARKQRSDGAEARARLLQMALRLFADKGFSKTSTREIAQAAGVNIASIKYYFGDKAGLYRAVFTELMGSSCEYTPLNQDTLTLHESLAEFFTNFLEPLKQGDLVQLGVRLHFREMLDPTGLWEEEIGSSLKPAHDALVVILMRHLDVVEDDDEIHRLVFCIVGMAVHLMIAHDVIDTIRPNFINAPTAIDLWAERLTAYAEAMVAVEATRRRSLTQ